MKQNNKNHVDIYKQTESLLERYTISKDNLPFSDLLGLALRAWSDEYSKDVQRINVLSLFTGGGGLDIGFHDCGFLIRAMVEIDPKFSATLKKNTKKGGYLGEETKVETIDINKYQADGLGEIDFVIGGPPCQTFSAAGRRVAGVLGFCDSRGLLFQSYAELLKKLKPSGFLFENVYGLTGAQKGELWEDIKKGFSDAGFKIFWRILDAADFGVPQHRERVFIVGVKKGEYEFPRPTHGPDSYCGLSGLTPADALKGLKAPDTKKKEFGGKYGHLLKEIPPGLNYSFFTSKLGHPRPVFAWRSKFSDFLYKADPNMPVRTIKASGGKYTGPLHWDNRHFTVDELKRLQTFPDGYKIAGNHGTSVKQLGNSVPPNLARILALSILDQVFRIPVPIKLQYLDPDEKLGFRQRKRDLTKYYQRLAMEHHKKTEKKDLIPDVGEYNLFLRMAKYFEIIEVTPDIGFFTVNVNLTETEDLPSLFIDFHLNELVELADKLEIKLFSKKWDLDLSFIEVKADLISIIDWTKMWKGLEFVLKKKFGIDDLVQLRGYYQYKPSFSIELSNKSSIRDDLFRILLITVENSISGHILDSSTLAKKWEVDESKVLDIAKKLKEIGYEIRNHRTNPQIPEGHYLIPYPFPTLNSKSVQLNKKL